MRKLILLLVVLSVAALILSAIPAGAAPPDKPGKPQEVTIGIADSHGAGDHRFSFRSESEFFVQKNCFPGDSDGWDEKRGRKIQLWIRFVCFEEAGTCYSKENPDTCFNLAIRGQPDSLTWTFYGGTGDLDGVRGGGEGSMAEGGGEGSMAEDVYTLDGKLK